MQNIPAVASNPLVLYNAEFVKLTVYNDVANLANVTIHTFSSAYKEETIDGQAYTPLGGLLAVGVQQRDIRATSADTSLSLSGIDGNNIYIVLATKVKGSKLEITRGFYDANGILTSNAHRFTGIVTSYNIAEDMDTLGDSDNFTVTLNASSFKAVLENRIAGRKTNPQSWTYFNSTDSSMNNIYSISDQNFDFGKTPLRKAATVSQAQVESTQTTESFNSTDGGGP